MTAVGAVLLAATVALVTFRLDGDWSDGVHLAIALVIAAALLLAGLARAPAGDRPIAATPALLLAGLAVWAIADYRLLEVTGGSPDVFEKPRTLTVFFALITSVAAVCWVRARSSACLLVAAIVGGATVLAGVWWLFDTDNVDSFRATLLVLAVAYAVAAWGLRGHARDRDVMVDAAGLAIFAITTPTGDLFFFTGDAMPDGWEAVVLAGAVGLVAYTARTHAPGPGVLALILLAGFVVAAMFPDEGGEVVVDGAEQAAADDPGLMGWPLVLLAVSLSALAYGMLSGRRNRDHDPDRAVQPSD